MQYPADMDNVKYGIDEINHAMPPKENAWVVEEGEGSESMGERLH